MIILLPAKFCSERAPKVLFKRRVHLLSKKTDAIVNGEEESRKNNYSYRTLNKNNYNFFPPRHKRQNTKISAYAL